MLQSICIYFTLVCVFHPGRHDQNVPLSRTGHMSLLLIQRQCLMENRLCPVIVRARRFANILAVIIEGLVEVHTNIF